jgi:hypothetical protein
MEFDEYYNAVIPAGELILGRHWRSGNIGKSPRSTTATPWTYAVETSALAKPGFFAWSVNIFICLVSLSLAEGGRNLTE